MEETEKTEKTGAARNPGVGRLRLRSVVVKPSSHRVSYRDVLVGRKTFKPRFDKTMEEYDVGA